MFLHLLCKALSRFLSVQGCSFGLSVGLLEITKEEIHIPEEKHHPIKNEKRIVPNIIHMPLRC